AWSADPSRYVLFWYRPDATGVVDPVFGRDLAFHLAAMPVLDAAASWLLALAVVIAAAALVVTPLERAGRFRALSGAAALMGLALAVQAVLYRYHRLSEAHPLFSGVGYVDDRVRLPGLWIVAGALVA